MIHDSEFWRSHTLFELVVGSERDAHAKIRDLRASVAPGDSMLAVELPKVMTVRDGKGRTEQIHKREFWLRHFNAFRADAVMRRLTQTNVDRPVCLAGEGHRAVRPCFSVLDAWYVCRTCGPESADIKRTVHDAHCEKCGSWMEWR